MGSTTIYVPDNEKDSLFEALEDRKKVAEEPNYKVIKRILRGGDE